MNSCEQTASQMLDFIAGDLPDREASALRSHCDDCKDCRETLEAHQMILRADSDAMLEDVPEHLAQGILMASANAMAPTSQKRPWRLLVTLAALLLLAASLWMSFDGLRFGPFEAGLDEVVHSAQDLQLRGQNVQAEAILNARLSEHPDDAETPQLMHELAILHKNVGDLERAWSLLTELKAQNRDYPQRLEALLLLGDVMLSMRRLDGAARHYAWLAQEFPENQIVRELHSRSVATAGSRELEALGYTDTLDALGYIGD